MTAGTYTVLESTGGTITGMFENVYPFNLFGVNFDVQNTGSEITITLDSDLIFADANLDGFVGIDDLNIVLSNWNQQVPKGDFTQGDLAGIGDGFVGIDDLNIVLTLWNLGTPPSADALSAAIPEPGSASVLLVGAFAGCIRCRTRAAS